jgi:hypothetical protein
MRKVLTSLAVLGALVVASSSQAAVGTVYMGWNACNTTPTTDLSIPDGTSSNINLTVFVTGHDVATTAYQIWILYGDASKTVPDAWRFDAAGCQGSSFVTVNHLAPAAVAKACPSFQDAGGANQSLQIKDISFSPPTLPFATSLMRIVVANSYPAGNVPVAATKYFLMDAEFNELYGVTGASDPGLTCGGLETPMCFNLNNATYLDTDGNELPWTFHGSATGDWATAQAYGAGCQGTPAQTRTWGSIKNQYRN